MSTQDHQRADKWAQKVLQLLARHGHRPGFRWGKNLYLDLGDFFEVVAQATGLNSVEVAVEYSVRELTRPPEEND